jgi:hypothetical protein
LNLRKVCSNKPDGIAIKLFTIGEHKGYSWGKIGNFLFTFIPRVDIIGGHFTKDFKRVERMTIKGCITILARGLVLLDIDVGFITLVVKNLL